MGLRKEERKRDRERKRERTCPSSVFLCMTQKGQVGGGFLQMKKRGEQVRERERMREKDLVFGKTQR